MTDGVRIGFEVVGWGLAVAALPLFVELLVLSVAAALPVRRRAASARAVRLAVVVPAHNEEKLIGACVGSLRSSYEAAEVFVVAHNCSDGTASAAALAGATVLVLDDRSGGKGLALDFGFKAALAAGAEGVLVVDADSVVSVGLVGAVAARLGAGAGAVQSRYEVANAAATPRTRLAALAFLGMNVLRPRGRDRLGLSCGIFGNGFAVAAGTLRAVPYSANSLVEDLEYHLNLLRAGIRVEFLDEAKVLGEMPEGGAAAGTQRARWEGGRLLMRRLWAGPLALEVLKGRVRMLEPLLDLLAFPLATEAGLLALVVGCGLAGKAVWLALYGAVGLLTLGLYVGVAADLGPDPVAGFKALASAPGYVAWKVMMIPKTRAAGRKDAAWVRTKRNVE